MLITFADIFFPAVYLITDTFPFPYAFRLAGVYGNLRFLPADAFPSLMAVMLFMLLYQGAARRMTLAEALFPEQKTSRFQ